MITAQATIIGNVTSDPELKYTANNTALLRFTIASNHYWTDADGEKKESTSFIECSAWRYVAEDAANVLEKGVGVMVTGRLEEQTWEDKETGAKRSKIALVVDNVAILARSIESFERKRRANNEGGSSAPAKKAVSPRQAQQRQTVPAIQDNEEPF
jgi:single-strand DNA-binding protein